ncbi:FAR1 DNA-binding domain [Musa troglodytarum]|uniref:FAR1 DNA-binding domain n=1 Tax=Musa troglodytarum TaxID=320322 RepID=A0A9E7K2I1_9LILI|nr:FAR1 DNA-binding domain [Musa troglodytarum]URE01192.1 FAR1 DNA-binding domain [Musa troglodytarum]
MDDELINHHIEFEDVKAEVSSDHMDIITSLDEDNKMILTLDVGKIVSSQGDMIVEPYVGMEFESEEAAKTFYGLYARHVGFRVRISRYTRSRRDNSIISRRIVCSREGFREIRANESLYGEQRNRQRAATRVGCKAMIMIKKIDIGKWIVTKFIKDHNHGPVPPRKVENRTVHRDDELVEKVCIAIGDSVQEPFEGMEFESEEAAKLFYISYATSMGFRARISRYCRSRRDNSIISRQIVCSKEGFREDRAKKEITEEGKVRRPRMITRIGCKAMIIVKKMSGKWVVTKFEKEHNHVLPPSKKDPCHAGKFSNSQGAGRVSNEMEIDQSPTGTRGNSQESLTVLYNQLCYEAIKYAQEGATTEHTYNVAMAALKEAAEKVAAVKRNAGITAQAGVASGGMRQAFLVSTESSIGSLVQVKSLHNLQSQDKAQELKPQKQPVNFVLLPSSFLTDSNSSTCSTEAPFIFNVTADSLHGTQPSQTVNITNPNTVGKQSNNTTVLFPERLFGSDSEGFDLPEEEKAELHKLETAPDIAKSHQKSQKNGAGLSRTTQSSGKKISMGSSEVKLGYPALPVTVYMPVVGSIAETYAGYVSQHVTTMELTWTQYRWYMLAHAWHCISLWLRTPGPGTSYALLATPIEALSVSAGPVEFSRQSQDSSLQLASKSSTVVLLPSRGNPSHRKPYAGPNPEVHATAVACGARVISPKAAASLIKAIEARIRSSVAKSKLACGFRPLDSELTSPEPCNEEGKTKQNPMNIMSQGLEGSSEESKDDGSAEAMELEVEAGHPIAGADEQNQSLFEGQIGLLDPIGAADDMTVF